MENAPRFNFFSTTFLVGFGLGGFIGVLLGLLAFGLVKRQDDTQPASASAQTQATTVSGGLTVTATPEPKPKAKVALDVRLGPGTAFAVVGTIARGGEVEPVGRDSASEWIAIRFPPGSSARGWVQVSDVDNLTEVDRLAIVQPTPLPNTARSPDISSTVTSGGTTRAPIGDDSSLGRLPTSVLATPVRTGTVSAASATTLAAAVTPTPRVNTGPTDLVVSRISLLPDGRVSVTVGNRGPGDLIGKAIFVSVRDLTLRGEQLSLQVASLPVGGVVTLQSSTFRIDRETDVQAIVDPFGNVTDPDRSNNQISTTLSPGPSAGPTRGPGE